MKITGYETNAVSESQSGTVFEVGNSSTGSNRKTQDGDGFSDAIDLGSQSGLLSQAQNLPAESQVEQLRALVQSGQYQIDTRDLSQSIVAGAFASY